MNVQDAIVERVIKRQNFGVAFRYVQPIYTYNNWYTHHLVFDLPPRNMNATSQLVQLTRPKELNQRFVEFLSNLTTYDPIFIAMRQEVLYMQRLVDSIYDLFVEVDPSALSSRKRRYWCLFYCSDVATQTDLIMQFNRDSIILAT